jgi:putative ABC transport system permease protein
MLKLSWKSVLANKVRLMLTAIAIVLGVAFVAGSYVFTDSLKAAFDVLFEQEGQLNDLVVRAQQDFELSFDVGTVPETLLPELESIEGVERAVPFIQSYAQLVDKDGAPIGGNGPPTLGFSWVEGTEDVSALNLRTGRPPQIGGEILIDAYTADSNGFAVGDPIDVILLTGTETFEITGVVSFGDADNLLGATIAAFEMETAQRVFGMEGEDSQISIMATGEADVASLQQELASILPEGVEVITGDVEIEEGKQQVEEGVGFFNTALLVFAMIAVFVGGFIIQNTYRIIVSQRTRELAMLRAVGATGRQVTVMVFLEAFIVGVIGSAIGIGVGILLAQVLKSAFGAIGFGFPEGPLTIELRTIVIAMLVGVLITVSSAILPARKASGVAPIAAMRDVGSTYFKSLRLRMWAGLGVLALGALMLFVGLFGDVAHGLLVTGIGAAVVFLGVAILSPLIARRFGMIFGSPLPRLFGVTGLLAQQNAVRKPRRTAATASALMIGVALVSVIATLAASVKTTLQDAVGSEVIADYQIEAKGFADPTTTGVSPQLAEDLLALPEVSAVSGYRIGVYRDPETLEEAFLIGVDEYLDEMVRMELIAGEYGDLRPGTTVLDEDFAEDEDLQVGDVFVVEYPNGVIAPLEVVALYGNSLFQGTNVMISKPDFEANYNAGLETMLMLNVADGYDPVEARPTIEAAVAEYPNVEMSNAEEYVDKVAGQVDLVLNILTALLAMAILIALLGIANTMALSIMERRREIGLLRAVGMTRRQTRRMIRWEAVLIGVFGAALGLVVGVVLGIVMVIAIGEGLQLTLPWVSLGLYLVAAAFGGVLASVLPARRGSRMNVLEAIAYE